MTAMLVTLGALSTPLAAQMPVAEEADGGGARGGAFGVGFVATMGDGWQVEGVDVAYVHRRPSGLLGALSVGARLGAFIDEAAIFGGARGFIVAATLGARTGQTKIAELGDELHVTEVALDLTFEATGYLAANSPLTQGSRWGALALLPGVRIGSGAGPRYSIMVGPTVFLGSGSDVRGLLAFRVETPLARRER
ncbi:MAG: hypothetical protein ACREME_06990, partial [Gemmatimonadales bacterium]